MGPLTEELPVQEKCWGGCGGGGGGKFGGKTRTGSKNEKKVKFWERKFEGKHTA